MEGCNMQSIFLLNTLNSMYDKCTIPWGYLMLEKNISKHKYALIRTSNNNQNDKKIEKRTVERPMKISNRQIGD